MEEIAKKILRENKSHVIRISKEDVEWLKKIDLSPRKAITKLRLGEDLKLSQYEEFALRFKKLEDQIKKLEEFIESKTAY